MGGDKAPDEIVAGAHRAVAELGVPVVLVGQPEVLEPLAGDLEIIPASEVIPMSADPGASVRRMKDSSLVRAAEAVRDGKASAMISAGNTGATMASALLRMGRIKGVSRPAIATPIPVPGQHADGAPRRRRQRRVPGRVAPAVRPDGRRVRPRAATASSSPRVGLLSIGEEASKGTPLVKETQRAAARPPMPSSRPGPRSSATSRVATS